MSNTSPKEKPYDFVPLPDKLNNKQAAGHHTLTGTYENRRLSGVIRGKIINESLIQIASGFIVPINDVLQFEDIDQESVGTDQLIASHMRTNKVRIIPGSTLKGAIRSAVEAITATGTSFQTELRSKQIRRGRNSISVREIKMRMRYQELPPPPQLPLLSLANRLFGITSSRYGYQGQCSFYDAPQQKGNGVLFRRLPLYRPQPDYSEGDPRLETGWQRYFLNAARTQVRGRKFYRTGISSEVDEPYTAVEACSSTSEFDLQIHFQNLSEAELGVILIVMGADDDIPRLKIGSGKPISMGAVCFSDLTLMTISNSSYLSFDTTWEAHSVAECVSAANASLEIVDAARKKLAEIMSKPTSFTAGGDERIY